MPELERVTLSNKLGVINCEGNALSVRNMCLLALQCPAVSVVGGFRQWISQGRCVRKGEHGHMIWCPASRKVDGVADTGEATEGSETYFIIGTVFDISQTVEIDGQTLEENTRVDAMELAGAV